MTTDHERRSRLMGFKIKQQSWDLEDLKKRNHSAQEALTKADQVLREIENSIEEAENSIRQVYEGQPDLDLEAIETARQFLTQQQGLRVLQSKNQQRAAQKVDQAQSRLKQTILYIKALEQIKAASDKQINRTKENRASEQLAELWRQRYGRN